MVGNGTVPTFGLCYDFRQKLPLGHYARFYAECLEASYYHLCFWGRLPGVTHEQALANMRLFASDVIPRVRDAVKI
ncbi:MAG TPA: hypothetical protein VNT12_02585 [Rubrobacter sp.]|nr:hypothetical protein [Rubrobacter sp.]